jgi:hypothetical protein
MQIFHFVDQGWGSNKARRTDGHEVKFLSMRHWASPTISAAPLFEKTHLGLIILAASTAATKTRLILKKQC